MALSTHIEAFKNAYQALRTDTDMTLAEKATFIAETRHTLSLLLKKYRAHTNSINAQGLNTEFQNIIEEFDEEDVV